MLFAVRIDTGQLHGSPFVLGDIRLLAKAISGSRYPPRQPARPQRVTLGGDQVKCRAEQPIDLPGPPHPHAGHPGPLQKPCMADGVGGVCSHLPQVGRSDQQVGGLARRGELLGEVGALQEGGERRRGVSGPFVVGCEVAEPAQLVNPLGRDRLQLSGPGRVHRRRLARQVRLDQDVGQQRVPEPHGLTVEHDDTGVDRLADRPGIGGVEMRGDSDQGPQARSGDRRRRGSG